MRPTVSSRVCASVAASRNSTIFSTITSTLCDFVMRYSRSMVFFLRLSSGSVRQSTTAIWCSFAYFGLMLTTRESASRPTYLMLLFLDCTNRLTTLAQCSNKTDEG